MTMPTMAPCYESTTKRYRHEMAGSPEAANLPKPTDEAIQAWGTAKTRFEQMMVDIDDGLRAAEAAHEGRAADSANASISEIKPHAERIAQTSGQIKTGLQQQVDHQNHAFAALPTKGETLENGREVQIDPPEKGWVENAGLDKNPITGWMSDYEERQEDFRSTNDRAQAAMQRYQSQTDTNLGQLPRFQQEKAAPPPPQPPPGSGMTDANSAMSGSGYSSTPSMSSGGGGTPAASSSSWASAPVGGASGGPAPSAPTPPPASTGSVWAPGPGGLPPGVVRGPDGTLYRQNASGAWERQNAYNGRWAPSPGGGPGGAGGGAAGGAAGARGAGSAGSGQPAAGGRAGVGGMGGSAAGGSAAGGSGASGTSGARGGAPMGGGAGARGGQGGEEEEHDRPSWLVETEDVFTNDMQRVAPPVLGDDPGGK